MREKFKDFHEKLFSDRLRVVMFVMIAFSLVLAIRLFVLQIIHGKSYQSSYNLLVEKKETVEATRGKIYDRNGKLLAYNDLAYEVTIQDTYSNYSKKERNSLLNKELATLIPNIEKNGDTVAGDFYIQIDSQGKFFFTVDGTTLQRFRADIFGRKKISDLSYKNSNGINETDASAETIMNYLMGDKKYNVSKKFDKNLRYKIAVIRYKMGLNSYQKYVATTIATNVSDHTVAYVKENINDLPGVEISETTIRKYNDANAFASIIGYTGTISTTEYSELKKTDKTATMNDVIGKSGMEQYMDSTLRGKKGSDTLYVDNVGNLIKETNHKNPVSGNDVYLSIDRDLQVRTYNLLEKEIAGILSQKMVNAKSVAVTTDTSDMSVAVYDAYAALITNGVVNSNKFKNTDATDLEKLVYSEFLTKQDSVLQQLSGELSSGSTGFGSLDDEMQSYDNYVIRYLKSTDLLKSDSIDTSDDKYKAWANGSLSISDYLKYGIEKNWINTDSIKSSSKYVDTDEIYNALVKSIVEQLKDNSDFNKLVYRYAVLQDVISPGQVCALLYDQGVLPQDDATRNGLLSGSVGTYNFIISKINNLEITPGMLGLKPCSGSCVITDTTTGAVLACVSYPGYDNNRLANSVDSDYYSYLNSSSSKPLYNFATQQRTAPGSTFKPLSSAAGLAEGVITTSSTIQDLGVFEKVSNKPRCWIYTQSHATHGVINVSEAIRDSCNYFFYEVGYRLAGGDGNYNDSVGIEKIQKYANMFGLDQKTGVEIEENTSTIATEYPVMAAIGQSNNNITTIALARYVTAIANRGTVYNLSLLDHTATPKGETINTYGSTEKNKVTVLGEAEWTSIQTGMRMVVENLSVFKDFSVAVSGKTGTAQESKKEPPHALFMGFAPSDNPHYAVATRIANGYTSHNAADVSKDIIGCIFGDQNSIAVADSVGAKTASNEASND